MHTTLAQLDFDTVATTTLFYAFALVVVSSSIGVVVSTNVVRTAACLLFALVGVAGLYVLLSAEFLAAVQVVVYVGGTLILIVFGVMLTSKSAALTSATKRGEIVFAMALGSVMLASMVIVLLRTTFADHPIDPAAPYPAGPLGAALLGDYLIPFELTSVALLVVMIGAAYLAKSRRVARHPS